MGDLITRSGRVHAGAVWVGVMLALLLSGCTSVATKEKEIIAPEVPGATSEPVTAISIDYLGLHRSLGLERPAEDLGFMEKSFNTCAVGYGYSASRDCHREYFVAAHFQLLCRDSEGTISTALSRDDMKPLSGRTVTWTLDGARGTLQLDGEGYGQIKTTFVKSQKAQRLKLTVDNDFVYVRAGEVKRLVTPRNWCN